VNPIFTINIGQGVELCFNFSLTSNYSSYKYLDIGISDKTLTNINIIGFQLDARTTNPEICIPLNSTSQSQFIYFPLGITTDLNVTYLSTFTIPDIFLLFLGGVIYLALFATSMFYLIRHIIFYTKNNVAFFTIPRISLTLLALFVLDRFIYICFIASDTLYHINFLNVLFAELPALMFYSIISLLGFSWAEISHTKLRDQQKAVKSGVGIIKLRPYLIGLNVFMYLMVLVFGIVYYSIKEDNIIVTCSTPQQDLDRLTSQEIIAIVYVIIYAFLSVVMLSLIEVYGAKIILKLGSLPDSNFKKAHFQTTALVMIFCGVFLILQLIYLFTRAIKEIEWSPAATMIFLYCADLPSTLFFLFSFRKPYIGKKTNTKTQSLTTKGVSKMSTPKPIERTVNTDDEHELSSKKDESGEEKIDDPEDVKIDAPEDEKIDSPEFGGDKPIPRNKKVVVSTHRLVVPKDVKDKYQ